MIRVHNELNLCTKICVTNDWLDITSWSITVASYMFGQQRSKVSRRIKSNQSY